MTDAQGNVLIQAVERGLFEIAGAIKYHAECQQRNADRLKEEIDVFKESVKLLQEVADKLSAMDVEDV